MGMQIADINVTMFFIGNGEVNDAVFSSRGYTFSKSARMSVDTYKYFAEPQWIGGIEYPGTNVVNGKIKAPELRAVIEVETTSNNRSTSSSCDFLTNFRVTSAYQYDVFLEHPSLVTNRATVAQKIGAYDRFGLTYTMLTYDTHGTENKGFRKDERECDRNR